MIFNIIKKTVLAAMLILLSSTTMAESAKEYIANIGVEANLHGLERVKQTLVARYQVVRQRHF